jgi:ribonuclease HII
MKYTAYLDEVGMASIASSVLACCLVLPENTKSISQVKDSKKLTKKKREELYEELSKLPHAFGTASPAKIKELNIFWARFLAMRRALNKMKDYNITKVVVDGNYEIPEINIPQEAIIKADEKLWEMGASSILAKVKRDRMMTKLATIDKYSHYSWNTNAGYFSPQHRLGVIEHGPTTLHRENFGYFKYCLFCYNQYQEFKKQGKTLKDYLEYENQEKIKHGKSYYQLWKSGQYDPWKEVKYVKGD